MKERRYRYKIRKNISFEKIKDAEEESQQERKRQVDNERDESM